MAESIQGYKQGIKSFNITPSNLNRFSVLSFNSIKSKLRAAEWIHSMESSLMYRVSHETWQLVNSFECLLPFQVLYIKDFCSLFCFEINFIIIILPSNVFIILFGIKELNKLWKQTFKTIHQLSCFLGHPVSSFVGSSVIYF